MGLVARNGRGREGLGAVMGKGQGQWVGIAWLPERNHQQSPSIAHSLTLPFAHVHWSVSSTIFSR